MKKMDQEKVWQIENLKRTIEEKLAWGSSAQWTHQAFEELSELILVETSTKLSATTLKRLWGKVNYQSQPTTNTLNALSIFAGYPHWLGYVGKQDALPKQKNSFNHHSENYSFKKPKPFWSKHTLTLAIVVPLMVVVLLTFNQWMSFRGTVDPSKITFTSAPVAEGLPNTVVFHYDVSSVTSQNIAIQQSWDERLRASVAKDQNTYTTTYFYPGYFRAKLLVDNKVIKEHDLYLPSQGWLTIAEADPVPFYLPSDSSQDYLQVASSLLQEKELLSKDEVPWINYYYVDDLGEIPANNFSLETRIKNDFNQGEAICQTSQVNVICSKGHFALPLSIPGCVGQLTMALGDQRINGDTHDLSELGCNLSEWQTLRLMVRESHFILYLNGQEVYEGKIENDVGKVVGVRYRFHGPGVVDYVQIFNDEDKLSLDENF